MDTLNMYSNKGAFLYYMYVSCFTSTRWFKYDWDWFVCKQAALRSSCANLREWSHNFHPPSCSGYNLFSPVWELLEWWANRRYRGAWNNALWSNSSEKTSRPLKHSSPYCCWSLWWISADGTFPPTRNLITMRCSTLRGTFCSLITLATPRQDWTGSNPSRREGGGCGFTLSRSHSCCAVRLLYIQISPGHIWTTLYMPL